MKFWFIIILLVGLLSLLSVIAINKESSIDLPVESLDELKVSNHKYVTWDRFEIDRYMAAWLIKRFIDPEAEFVLVPNGSEISIEDVDAVPFDVPGGRWARGHLQCTSDDVLADIENPDNAIEKMVALVRKLEMAYWHIESGSDEERMNSSILKIIETSDNLEMRMSRVFKYFDDIYTTGHKIP